MTTAGWLGWTCALVACVLAYLLRRERNRSRRDLSQLAASLRASRAETAVERQRFAHGVVAPEVVLDSLPIGVAIAANGAVVAASGIAARSMGPDPSLAIVGEAIRSAARTTAPGRSASSAETQRTIELIGPPIRQFRVSVNPVGGVSIIVVQDRSAEARTDAIRRDFVANISHELKTPVGAVGLLSETLIDETNPAIISKFSNRILLETTRLANTIDDLLELAAIEIGEQREVVPVDVRALVDQAALRIESAAEQAEVEILIEDRRGAPMAVLGDRRQLVSAIFNLLDNAVKHSAPDTTIDVTVRPDAAFVEVSVRDRGEGIPAHEVDRIFERFYRVDRARSRATGGTGLGLAIVRNVLAHHGGSVTVDSTLGVGSTFTLRLPAAGRSGSASGGPDAPIDVLGTPDVAPPDMGADPVDTIGAMGIGDSSTEKADQ